MKDKERKEFKEAVAFGMSLVATAVRLYVDSSEEDGRLPQELPQEMTDSIMQALSDSIHDVLTMTEDEFAERVAIQGIGALGYEMAISSTQDQDNEKDGEPTHIC